MEYFLFRVITGRHYIMLHYITLHYIMLHYIMTLYYANLLLPRGLV